MENLLVPGRLGFQATKLAGFPSLFYRIVGGIVDKDVSVPMGAGSPLDRARGPPLTLCVKENKAKT
jgi:hypothetical protein